jgi:C4-dicarboxylate transporter
MTAALIAQLLVAFGPEAIQLIQELIAVWNKPSLSQSEVMAIIAPLLAKTPQQYLAAAEGNAPTPAFSTTLVSPVSQVGITN